MSHLGRTPLERFESFYIPEPNSGCWLWLGFLKPHSGHGTFWDSLRRRMIGAHVAAWRFYRGQKSKRLRVLHTCDVACCVNPDHLYLGTQLDNIRDREARYRTARGERINRGHLTAIEVLQIRQDRRTVKELMEAYDVSESTIRHIKNRRIWRHVP